jgi:hypothetical protein
MFTVITLVCSVGCLIQTNHCIPRLIVESLSQRQVCGLPNQMIASDPRIVVLGWNNLIRDITPKLG